MQQGKNKIKKKISAMWNSQQDLGTEKKNDMSGKK